MNAREQAIEAVFDACKPYSDEEDEFILAANSASDVWEPLLRDLLSAIADIREYEDGIHYPDDWDDVRSRAKTALGSTVSPNSKEHPSADKRKTFKVGFFAWVETEAFDEGEAGFVAEAALGWPGSWSPTHDPVESEGVINGYKVKARIIRTQALTCSEKDE